MHELGTVILHGCLLLIHGRGSDLFTAIYVYSRWSTSVTDTHISPELLTFSNSTFGLGQDYCTLFENEQVFNWIQQVLLLNFLSNCEDWKMMFKHDVLNTSDFIL